MARRGQKPGRGRRVDAEREDHEVRIEVKLVRRYVGEGEPLPLAH